IPKKSRLGVKSCVFLRPGKIRGKVMSTVTTTLIALGLLSSLHGMSFQPDSSADGPAKTKSNFVLEKSNRQIIRAAVEKSLDEANNMAVGKMKLSIKLRASEPVVASSFSPIRKQVVVAQGMTAILYDLKEGVELRLFRHAGLVTAAAFSPDGNLLATASTDK